MTINHTEGAVDRAERLMKQGKSLQDAAIDAGHFFSCSSEVVKAALKVRLQHTAPATGAK